MNDLKYNIQQIYDGIVALINECVPCDFYQKVIISEIDDLIEELLKGE